MHSTHLQALSLHITRSGIFAQLSASCACASVPSFFDLNCSTLMSPWKLFSCRIMYTYKHIYMHTHNYLYAVCMFICHWHSICKCVRNFDMNLFDVFVLAFRSHWPLPVSGSREIHVWIQIYILRLYIHACVQVHFWVILQRHAAFYFGFRVRSPPTRGSYCFGKSLLFQNSNSLASRELLLESF